MRTTLKAIVYSPSGSHRPDFLVVEEGTSRNPISGEMEECGSVLLSLDRILTRHVGRVTPRRIDILTSEADRRLMYAGVGIDEIPRHRITSNNIGWYTHAGRPIYTNKHDNDAQDYLASLIFRTNVPRGVGIG